MAASGRSDKQSKPSLKQPQEPQAQSGDDTTPTRSFQEGARPPAAPAPRKTIRGSAKTAPLRHGLIQEDPKNGMTAGDLDAQKAARKAARADAEAHRRREENAAKAAAGNAEAVQLAQLAARQEAERQAQRENRLTKPRKEKNKPTEATAPIAPILSEEEAAQAAIAQALEQRIGDLQRRLDANKTLLRTAETHPTPNEREITKRRKHIAILHDDLKDAIEERGMTPEQIAERNATRELEKRIAGLQKDLTSAEHHLAMLQKSATPHQPQIQKKTQSIAELRKKLDAAIAERNMTPAQIAARRATEMEQLAQQQQDLTEQLRQHQQTLQQQADDIAAAKAQERVIPALKTALQIAQEAKARSEDRIRAENEHLEQIIARIAKLQHDLQTAEAESDDIPVISPEKLTEQEQAAKATRNAIADVAGKLHKVTQELKKLEKQTRPAEASAKAENPRKSIRAEDLKKQWQAMREQSKTLREEYEQAKQINDPNASKLGTQLSELDKRIAKMEKRLRRIDPSAVEVQAPAAPAPTQAPRPRTQATPPAPAAKATAETQAPPPPPAEQKPAPEVTAPAPKPARRSLQSLIRERAQNKPTATPRPNDVPAAWQANNARLAAEAAAATAVTPADAIHLGAQDPGQTKPSRVQSVGKAHVATVVVKRSRTTPQGNLAASTPVAMPIMDDLPPPRPRRWAPRHNPMTASAKPTNAHHQNDAWRELCTALDAAKEAAQSGSKDFNDRKITYAEFQERLRIAAELAERQEAMAKELGIPLEKPALNAPASPRRFSDGAPSGNSSNDPYALKKGR